MFPRKEQGIPVNGMDNYVMDDAETMTFFAIPGIGKTVLLHLIDRKAQSLVDEDSKQPHLLVIGTGLVCAQQCISPQSKKKYRSELLLQLGKEDLEEVCDRMGSGIFT
jgi:hypothetical protein